MERTTQTGERIKITVEQLDGAKHYYEFHRDEPAFADIANTLDHLRGHLALEPKAPPTGREQRGKAAATV